MMLLFLVAQLGLKVVRIVGIISEGVMMSKDIIAVVQTSVNAAAVIVVQ